ncbi:hypothetical protein D1872_266380 [compost metagenome]
MVLKLTPTIRMKPLDLAQVAFYRCKGTRNQSSVLMWTCTMANDLAIEQVNEDANVVPSVPWFKRSSLLFGHGKDSLLHIDRSILQTLIFIVQLSVADPIITS